MESPDPDGYKYSADLICSKARVTPRHGCTTPKSELNSATLLSRLIKSVAQAMVDTPSSAVCVGDSQCVISCLEMSTSRLKPYFHNRVSEIKENFDDIKAICPVEEFYYIQGDKNPADIATRKNGKLVDIGPGSEWQSPSFLKQPRDSWPVTRDFVRAGPPPEELRKKTLICSVQTSPKDMKIWVRTDEICNYSNDWSKVSRIMARTLRGWTYNLEELGRGNILEQFHLLPEDAVLSINKTKFETFVETMREPVTNEELIKAEKFLMVFGMLDTWSDYENNKLTSLLPFVDKYMIYTRGRVGEAAMERILGIDKLPILSAKSRVAWLLMHRAHTEDTGFDHRGVTSTLAKSRTRAWIVNGRRLAKQIRRNCPYCRRKEKKREFQQMSLVKDEQLEPCPPFTNIALDYAGPLVIYGEVNKRTTRKVWILVYVCRSTRAIVLLATTGYDTDSFLQRHQEFVFKHGKPASIVSDRGSQLVRAGLVLSNEEDNPSGWNWKKIVKLNSASNWIFTEIGCAWRNGLSESMVKLTKKCLDKAIPEGAKITYGELVTLLAGISYTINCRPLGVKGSNDLDEEIQPITPNMLLLGRCDFDSKSPPYNEDISLPTRTAYVKDLLDKWWSLWIKQVWPHLIPCKKWKEVSRNLQVGDVCLLYYPGALTGQYKLVRVVEVHPDANGLVRTVTILYRKRDKREKKREYNAKHMVREKVGVQRLVLIQSANENDDADDSINPVDAEPAKLVLGGQVDVLSTHHHDEQAELVLRGQVDVPLSSCLPDMTPVPLPPVSIPDIPLLVHDVQDHHVPAVVRQL